ncbi:Fic family protein [Pseudoflavitalea sp. X16]|uniref:Fic family protein n=1 Tax=Paraflavitalea devenefica TaxID=2716334 RepID=UPI0014239919|nr:Fic family protein [Paraflavitalea devenefica]NII29290.1 Fic family protein [Paraflavitalea devenefica]
MATPAEKLATSLDALKQLQEKGIVAIKTDALSRINRERLLDNGFIREVYKGWYMVTPPTEAKGDSTSWYSSYWSFCAQLLANMYGQNWCISAEQSLSLHAGNWTVPQQLIIKSPQASNNKIDLPFGTSLFHIKSQLPAKTEIIDKEGIRMLSLTAALVQVSPNTYTQNPTDARTALTMTKDASPILALLLEGGQSVVAGRLAGAFRNVNQDIIADTIVKTMEKAGYNVRESDPFENRIIVPLSNRASSPYGNRIRLIWHHMRDIIITHFPKEPGIPKDKKKYMKMVEKIYVTDAYHSLSIEKYKVTPELIERVRKGIWNLQGNEEDRKQRDAMAAKGYWEAFQAVERSITRVLAGENPGEVVDIDHAEWYRELFAPSVSAGLLKPADLAGYRNHQVYISQSKHVPLNKEAVRDAMPVFFKLLQQEQEASVRAVLGHFIFVFIHPYMDGNGRMGRFLMNVMLASGGYPWTVIPVQERTTYMQALEKASVDQDIEPFAKFLGNLVQKSLKGTPVAKV